MLYILDEVQYLPLLLWHRKFLTFGTKLSFNQLG